MELLFYPRMCRESKLCMTREKWRWGRAYYYRPHAQLLRRLAQELNMSVTEVLDQIRREQAYLRQNPHLWRL